MKILSFLLLIAVSAASWGSVGWLNLDEGRRLGGRKASAGYLQGKVVLVARWDAAAAGDLPVRLEELWSSFKGKQFVILGSPVGEPAQVRAAVAGKELSYPLYEGVGLAEKEPQSGRLPFLYVVDETGKTVYLGHDDRAATQAVVMALTDMDAPKSLAQWRRFLDFEIENLPAHAFNRLRAFRKAFPREAAYREKERALSAIPKIREVADLVAFAKRAKDAPVFTVRERAKRAKFESLVRGVLEKCAPLKDVENPLLMQEAKNSLADLTWVEAAF